MSALWPHSQDERGLLARQNNPKQEKGPPVYETTEGVRLSRCPNLGMPTSQSAFAMHAADPTRLAAAPNLQPCNLPGAAPFGFKGALFGFSPLTLRRPHSIALEPSRGYTASSTPLFSSLCKIFRTNDVNSPNTSTIIAFDK